jgi:hypothetical protein
LLCNAALRAGSRANDICKPVPAGFFCRIRLAVRAVSS